MCTSNKYALGSEYFPAVVKHLIQLGEENILGHFILQKVFKPWRTQYESVNYGISNYMYWST